MFKNKDYVSYNELMNPNIQINLVIFEILFSQNMNGCHNSHKNTLQKRNMPTITFMW